MQYSSIIRSVVIIALCTVPAMLGAQDLTLSYFDRPPYYYTEGKSPKGFLLDRAAKILDEAGLSYSVQELPSSRISVNMRSGVQRMISVGWFKTAEREAYSTFSLPFYRNLGEVVLTRESLAEPVASVGSFSALTADTGFRLGSIEGFSYGDYVDTLIRGMESRNIRVTVSAVQLVSMLDAGRFDYMIVDPEEVSFLLERAGLDSTRFAVVPFSDIPEGNLRYLWCSALITAEERARIDAAILKLYSDVR